MVSGRDHHAQTKNQSFRLLTRSLTNEHLTSQCCFQLKLMWYTDFSGARAVEPQKIQIPKDLLILKTKMTT